MLKKEKGGVVVKLLIIFVLLAIILGVVAFLWYNANIKPVQSNSEKVVVEIQFGYGIPKIAEQLEEAGVIRNANAFKVYCKLNKRTLIKAGKYELDKNMTIDEILSMMEKENILNETVKITFPEGTNMKGIAKIIAEKTNNREKDVFDLLKNKKYLDGLIDKYWFITKDIKNEELYYPLEGYLYPDTYIFTDENESVENIFEKMLDKMDAVITPYKDKIESGEYTVHEVLTLASMVELEANKEEDRRGIAAVFLNRLENNMPLQSDVTTYYGLQIAMDSRKLTQDDLNKSNGFNTYASDMAGKVPLGPICTVSDTAIKAVVTPEKSDYLYFLADKNGEVYFNKTNEEHQAKYNELVEEGLWD